jgi:hypothetical protein
MDTKADVDTEMDAKMDVDTKLDTLVLQMDAEGTAFHLSNAVRWRPVPVSKCYWLTSKASRKVRTDCPEPASSAMAATPASRALELEKTMVACGEQLKETLEKQLARREQADLKAQQELEKEGKPKRVQGKRKTAIVERSLACTKAAIMQSISIDGGQKTFLLSSFSK